MENIEKTKELRVGIDNFIPRSAMIRNTEKVLGLVVYVGRDTKIMKNTQSRIFKKSSLEKQMNLYILYIIGILSFFLIILGIFASIKKSETDFAKDVLDYS